MSRSSRAPTYFVLAAWACVLSCGDSSSPSSPSDASGGSAGDGGNIAAGHAGDGSAGTSGGWAISGASGSAGSGGSAGTSAMGGAGQAGNSTVLVPGIPPWLTDESAWEPFTIPNAGWDNCTVSHALPEQLPHSDLSWESCGEGCSLMDLTWMDKPPNGLSLSHIDYAGSKVTLLAASWFKAPYGVRRVIDVETGMVRNALRGVSNDNNTPIFNSGWGKDARYLDVGPKVQPSNTFANYDVWLKEDGRLLRGILAPADFSESRYFFSDAGEGRFFAGSGNMRTHGYGDGSTSNEIIATELAVHDGDGQGELAIWLTGVDKATLRVQGWAPDGKGTRDLLDVPRDASKPNAYAYGIALSATRMVGTIPVPYVDDPSHAMEELRLWTSPRATSKEQASLTISPPLPLEPGASLGAADMITWGDFALLRIFNIDLGKSFFWLIHVPTWKVYVIGTKADDVVQSRAYTLDSQFAYISYQNKVDKKYSTKRLELSKLEKTADKVLQAP